MSEKVIVNEEDSTEIARIVALDTMDELTKARSGSGQYEYNTPAQVRLAATVDFLTSSLYARVRFWSPLKYRSVNGFTPSTCT